MTKRYEFFPKQLKILIVFFAVLLIATQFMMRVEDEDANEVEHYLIVAQNLPEIPKLHGWPDAFYEELKLNYLGVSDFDGSYLQSFENIGYLYLSNGYVLQAREIFAALLDLDSRNLMWLYCYARSWADVNSKEKIASLQRFVSSVEGYSVGHSMLVEAFILGGQMQDAVDFSKRSYESPDPDAFAVLDYANALLSEGNSDVGSRILSEFIDLNPKYGQYLEELENVYELGREFEEEEVFEGTRVARLSRIYRPDHFELHLESFVYGFSGLIQLAENRISWGDLEGATAVSNKIKKLYPSETTEKH